MDFDKLLAVVDNTWQYNKLLCEAVIKQISKKPRVVISNGVKELYCPACENLLTKQTTYCDSCGQKLDWEEDEDYDTESTAVSMEQ